MPKTGDGLRLAKRLAINNSTCADERFANTARRRFLSHEPGCKSTRRTGQYDSGKLHAKVEGEVMVDRCPVSSVLYAVCRISRINTKPLRAFGRWPRRMRIRFITTAPNRSYRAAAAIAGVAAQLQRVGAIRARWRGSPSELFRDFVAFPLLLTMYCLRDVLRTIDS